jgi:hypothetical protein
MKKSINSKTVPESLVASVSVSAFLTGKAKQDFKKWYQKRLSVMTYSEILNINDLTVYSSLIIEWFDSIGFYIKIHPHLGGGQNVFYPSFIYRDEKYNENERNVTFDDGELYYSINRQEVTIEVVKMANAIYNDKVVQAEH